jgi:hypothetical protein
MCKLKRRRIYTALLRLLAYFVVCNKAEECKCRHSKKAHTHTRLRNQSEYGSLLEECSGEGDSYFSSGPCSLGLYILGRGSVLVGVREGEG